MPIEASAILSIEGKEKGLQKVLDSAGKSFDTLSGNIGDAQDGLKDWNSGLKATEKALLSATKTTAQSGKSIFEWGNKAGKGYDQFIDGAEKTIDTADMLDKGFVRLGAKMLGFGKPLNTVNNQLQPLAGFFADVADQQDAAGKAAIILDSAEKPLVNTLKAAAGFTKAFAEQLEPLGPIGEFVATKMFGLSNSLQSVRKAVGMADTAGDIYLAVNAAKDFATEAGPALVSTAQAAGAAYEQFNLQNQFFGDNIKTATTVSKGYLAAQNVFPQVQNAAAKSIAQTVLQVVELNEKFQLAAKFAGLAMDAFMAMQNLNQTFAAFQSMGIDSSYAELALQIGFVGEGLLFNAEAAQKFAQTAIGAYAQLQDQLTYVQTLGSAAETSQVELGNAMQRLVDGPLKNSITSAEAASALYNTMSAGITNTSAATNFMAAGLKLAAGSGAEATTTMEALIKTSNAYGRSARDAGKTAAQLNAIVENGIVSFPQLAGGFSRVASVAAPAGVKLEELGGSIAALTYNMTADDAMTGFSSLLNSIAGQGAQAEKAVAELGIKFDTNTVKTKGLVTSLKELYNATGGNIEKLKEIIPDALALNTALSLMTSGSEKAKEYTKGVGEAQAESLDAMFNRRQTSLIKESTALMNGFQEVFVSFGARMVPLIEPGIKFLQGVLDMLKNMPEPIKNIVGSLVVAKLGFDNVVGVGNQFISTMMEMAKSMILLRAAQLAMSGQLMKEVSILREMVTVNKDYVGALLRMVGIHELVEKAVAKGTAARAAEAAASQATIAVKAQEVTAQAGAAVATGAHTAAIEAQGVAQKKNAIATAIAGTATKAWAVIQKGAAIGATLFSNAISFAGTALKAFWVTLGPIALALGAIVALFGVFQDFVPALGGVAGQSEKTAESLDKVTFSFGQAGDAAKKAGEEAQKYSGNMNTMLLPALQKVTESALFLFKTFSGLGGLDDTFTGGKIFAGMQKGIEDFFGGTKDNIQAIIDQPVIEAIERADEAISQQITATMKARKKLSAGEFFTSEAKGILEKARNEARALTGDELNKALSEDQSAIKARITENDRLANSYKEQLETIKNPEQKAALEARINALNEESSKLEEINKKQQEYVRNLNAIANAIEVNSAGKDATKLTSLIGQRMNDVLKDMPKEVGNTTKDAIADTFNQLDTLSNKASAAQRKSTAQLANTAASFFDNVKNAANIKSQEGLSKLRQDADEFLEKINGAVETGSISREFANRLREQVANQEIEIPALNLKGSILSPEQTSTINKAIVDDVRAQADQVIQIEQKKTAEQQALLAEHKIGAVEANKAIAASAIRQAQTSVKTEEEALKRTAELFGEGSEQYKQQLLKTEQARLDLRQKRASADDQNFEVEQERENRLAELEKNRITQGIQKRLDAINIEAKGLEMIQALEQSRFGVVQAIADYEMNQLQNRAKLTGDSEEQAQIELEMADKRAANLERQQAFEQQNLERQIKQNQLAAEREILENQSAQAENKRAVAQAKIELIKAKRQKATQEEIDLIEQQIDALDQQGSTLVQQGGQLQKNKQQQAEIAKNSREELKYKQASAKENAAVEKQLAVRRAQMAALDKQQKQIDLQVQKGTQGYKARLSTLDSIGKQLDIQRSLEESRQKVVQAQFEAEDARLQDQLKLTQDVEKRAQIEAQLAANRVENLAVTQAAERRNLETQMQSQRIAAEREVLNNRIAQAENNRAIAQAKIELIKARISKKSKEEVALVEQQISSLQQQGTALQQQGGLLEQSQRSQEELAQNARKEMEYRQGSARESAVLDAELAKRRIVAAAYEKQQERAGLLAKQADVAAMAQLEKADAVSKIYERQNAALEAQKSLIGAQASANESYFKVAIDSERSEKRRQKMTDAMNKMKIAGLMRQQAIERQIFDIQQLQNKAALEREKIQNRVQQAQSAAEIAGAMADLKKVESDPSATDEQKQAAGLGLKAAMEKGAALQFAGVQLEAQGKMQEQLAGFQRQAMMIGQDQAMFDTRFNAMSKKNQRKVAKSMGRNLMAQATQFNGINLKDTNILPAISLGLPLGPDLSKAGGPGAADYDKVKNKFIEDMSKQLNVAGGGTPQATGLNKTAVKEAIKESGGLQGDRRELAMQATEKQRSALEASGKLTPEMEAKLDKKDAAISTKSERLLKRISDSVAAIAEVFLAKKQAEEIRVKNPQEGGGAKVVKDRAQAKREKEKQAEEERKRQEQQNAMKGMTVQFVNNFSGGDVANGKVKDTVEKQMFSVLKDVFDETERRLKTS